MVSPVPSQSRQATAAARAEEGESLQQPLWHVITLTVLTCSAYTFYWFYKNWRALAAEAERLADAGGNSSALAQFAGKSCLLRAIGLVVPILNIYLALTQVKGIAELYPDVNAMPRKHPLASAGLIVASMLALSCLSRLPGTLYLLSLAVCVPLAVAQSWLNAYWRSQEVAPLPVRHAFTVKELAVLIAGSLLLGLIVAGSMIVPQAFNQ